MTKPISPYVALNGQFSEWIGRAICRRRKLMWTYQKEKLNDEWTLRSLYERVAAAKQLGHDVELKATDAGLEVWYVGPMPTTPWWYS